MTKQHPMPDEFDVVVIGGGPAGENVAWYARDKPGGPGQVRGEHRLPTGGWYCDE